MAKSTPIKHIVDIKTGEVTGEIRQGDRIIRKESVKHFYKTIDIPKNLNYVKWNRDTMSELRKEKLSANQWQIVATLAEYFRYESGLISYSNGKPLKVEDISKLSDISRSACFKDMVILIDKKIIAKTKVGHDIKFYINPFIFAIGKKMSNSLYIMFEDTKWFDLYRARLIGEFPPVNDLPDTFSP